MHFLKIIYSIGVLLMTASETEDSDILWCINHDSFPFKKPLMETQVGIYEMGLTSNLLSCDIGYIFPLFCYR